MARLFFVVTVAVAMHAAWGREAYPIGASQVVVALSAKGIALPAEQLSIAADVTASRPDPVLEVLAVGPIAGAQNPQRGSAFRYWVKLGCQAAGTCLAFYALVKVPAGDFSLWINGLRGIAGAGVTAMKPDGRSVVQAGARATLILEGARSRIEMPVVALEGGMTGSEIRVATPDHKSSYRATVVGPGLLKGSL